VRINSYLYIGVQANYLMQRVHVPAPTSFNNVSKNVIMKTIQLTQGKVALVDDEDVYYARRGVKINTKWTSESMHRQIMNHPEGMAVDHKDGNGLNNQRDNLRVCTDAQNTRNQKKSKNRSSKYLGVSWCVRDGLWQTHIWINGKNKRLGNFETELEGAIIYNIASRKYFGEYSRPNKLIKVA